MDSCPVAKMEERDIGRDMYNSDSPSVIEKQTFFFFHIHMDPKAENNLMNTELLQIHGYSFPGKFLILIIGYSGYLLTYFIYKYLLLACYVTPPLRSSG